MMFASSSVFNQSRERQKQLAVCMFAALVLHAMLITAVKLVPEVPALNEPVKLLKVKLGNSFEVDEKPIANKAQVPTESKPIVTAQEKTKPAPKITPSKKTPKKVASSTKQAAASKKKSTGQAAKQFTRKKVKPVTQAPALGDALGNKQKADQQRAIRYTQKISLWIEKFKDYPQEVKDFGMEGVVKIYLTMDRKGNIKSRQITQHAPYPILDKLAMDAVRRSSPVPAVPDNYPDKSKNLAFIIALKFRLDR